MALPRPADGAFGLDRACRWRHRQAASASSATPGGTGPEPERQPRPALPWRQPRPAALPWRQPRPAALPWRQPRSALPEVVAVLQVLEEPRMRRLPSEHLPRHLAGDRVVHPRERAEEGEV